VKSVDRPWLAVVAVVPILATADQTLLLTEVIDDVIRKGIDTEHYSMIWANVCWGGPPPFVGCSPAVGRWPATAPATPS
jgi:hypothetical protein